MDAGRADIFRYEYDLESTDAFVPAGRSFGRGSSAAEGDPAGLCPLRSDCDRIVASQRSAA